MDHTLESMKSSFNFQPWLDWYLQETGQRLVVVVDLLLLQLEVMETPMLLLALWIQGMLEATVVAQTLLGASN